ncbi:hypothetical protein E3_1940 [Rhodococcus phage E3]|uniref:hypothetical protein n=1 Tax=Rhodococcus phage E3 TaxID=1007869 RepID=UPI0002C6B996|nr:hypothetical protein M176_gp206 [Rhodococcus phage E3]AEQ21114.1 hypothetical protein E3_1940 [Rhodococcus phage E3]
MSAAEIKRRAAETYGAAYEWFHYQADIPERLRLIRTALVGGKDDVRNGVDDRWFQHVAAVNELHGRILSYEEAADRLEGGYDPESLQKLLRIQAKGLERGIERRTNRFREGK